ncbi:MAG: hypothetical protein JW849_07695 [Phycisphaerae bacterium]|nr:hypothetical protein [Phycisphaerae bacterium]
MKRGYWLPVVWVMLGFCVTVAPADDAPTAPPADPILKSDDDASPMDVGAERWPGLMEPPPPPAVSPDDETKVLEFLQKHLPYYHGRLVQLKQRDEKAYGRALEYFQEKVRQLRAMPADARDAHVRNANLQVEILCVAREYHEAKTDPERDALKDKLRKLLSEKFDVEQRVSEYRLKQLDEKLNRRKKMLRRRAEDREKIINEQLRRRLEPPAAQPASPTTAPASEPS